MNLAEILLYLLNILSLLLIARALCSWFDPTFNSAIGRILFQFTEPIVAPIRQVVPPAGAFDFSIMVALFLLIALRQLISQALL